MQFHCLTCQLLRADGNLACQRVQCSSSHRIFILPPGELLNEIVITRLIKVTRTATFYEVQRSSETLWMKLAHPNFYIGSTGYDYSDYLKSEAQLLLQAQASRFSKQGSLIHSALPQLVSAWPNEPLAEQTCYQKVVYNGQLRYYLLFKKIDGIFLSSYLDDHPQPYYRHTIWLLHAVSGALNSLRVAEPNYVHLGLNPESIVVRQDDIDVLRPVIVDFGPWRIYRPKDIKLTPTLIDVWQRNAPKSKRDFGEHLAWLNIMIAPTYTPPQILISQLTTHRTSERYNLALLLYQMLTGEVPFQYHNLTDDMIYQLVKNIGQNLSIQERLRPDMDESIQSHLRQGLDPNSSLLPDVFVELLINVPNVGPVPLELIKQARWRTWLTPGNLRPFIMISLGVLGFTLLAVLVDLVV